MTWEGGCLCDAVRYEGGAPLYPPTFCHCQSCRRASGSHLVPWFTVAKERFRIQGDTLRWYASSAGVRRAFCATCGTTLVYVHADRPDEIDLTVGSLDNPGGVVPVDHIWMEDAVAWDRPRDELPCHARRRD